MVELFFFARRYLLANLMKMSSESSSKPEPLPRFKWEKVSNSAVGDIVRRLRFLVDPCDDVIFHA